MLCSLIPMSFRTGRTMVILLVYMDEMRYLRMGDFLTFCWIKQAESASLSSSIRIYFPTSVTPRVVERFLHDCFCKHGGRRTLVDISPQKVTGAWGVLRMGLPVGVGGLQFGSPAGV